MPRPVIDRRIRTVPTVTLFQPVGFCCQAESADVVLSLDEFEALRLADYEGLYQEAAALKMGISRQTFGRIVENARKKVADALVNGKILRVEGGNTVMEQDEESAMNIAVPTDVSGMIFPHFGHCDLITIFTVKQGQITAEEQLACSSLGGCKSGVASELARKKVCLLIAQNIGEGAVRQMASFGIRVVRGVSGHAKTALETLLKEESLGPAV
uniref:UPF0251 protein ENS59_00105 n=1 Tax=Gracilinema caldarium TaxID=215591 RepID=A0A7C3EAK9_9SPIR